MDSRKFLSCLIVLAFIIVPIPSDAETGRKCEQNNERALVLSGGGAKGAFEAGAIFHFVNHRDCDFRDIAGVSVGAVNGAYIAQAPSDENSLRHLQDWTQRLIGFWRRINGPDDILRPRCLGEFRLFLFGLDSLYDFTPLEGKIEEEIDPKKIRESKRSLRVGVVSFYDGVYHEIDPNKLKDDVKFRKYVLASTSIPVYAHLPRILSPRTEGALDSEIQYADGGVSHATPIVAYFSPCDFTPKQLLRDARQLGGLPPCVASDLNKHDPTIKELFVVVANPYDPALPSLETKKETVISNGRQILDQTIDVLFASPYRWDLNFALAANRMLKWREETYAWAKSFAREDKAREVLGIMGRGDFRRGEFPVESANPGPDGFSLSYTMGIVAPSKIYADTYGFDKANIRLQLYKGCIQADLMLAKQLGMGSMRDACKRDFLRDVDEQQLKDDPDPPL